MPVNLPNAISIGRLLVVPVIVWLILDQRFGAAFWLFLAACISDAVDGYIAKRFKAQTVFGGFIDPLADKALLVSTYISLGHEGFLDLWLVILVVFRDLLIVGGALLFYTITHSLTMKPLTISKITTVAQIGLAVVVLGDVGLGVSVPGLTTGAVAVVAITTLSSGAAYVVMWTKRAALMEDRE